MTLHKAIGHSGRCLIGRLAPGTDLMEGIRDAAADAGIRSAIVPVIVGGVGRAVLEVAEPAPGSPMGVVAKEIELDGPLAILGAQGMVCETDDGRIEPHIHITMTDSDGQIHGGHLQSGTAPVTSTADIVLQEVLSVRFYRRMDPELNALLFFPEQR